MSMLSRSTNAVVSRPGDRAIPCATIAPSHLPARRFTFPRDNGPHDAFATELWRTFGRVRDVAGNAYDVSLNVSRFAVNGCGAVPDRNRWTVTHVVTSAYGILDERSGRIARATHVERDGPLGATSARGRLDFRIAGVRLAEISGSHGATHFSVGLRHDARAALAIDEVPKRRPVPLGPAGVMETGSCKTCEAYAYAYTRNAARGTLWLDGDRVAIAGTMWMQHEFARHELDGSDAGWDRFDVTFDDGRDLDARFTRNPFYNRIVAVAGTLVNANGGVTYLDAGNAEETAFPPNSRWRSAASDVAYPSSWAFDGLDTSEVVQDQELFTPGRTPYYMGAIDVVKAENSGDRGHGFVELTGYANPVAL